MLSEKDSKRFFFHLLLILALSVFSIEDLAGQVMKDTLYINSGGIYPLNRHLYIYKNENKVAPSFVLDSVKPTDFSVLYPQKALMMGITNQYCWLVFTIKNNLQKDVSLFYEFNNPGIDVAEVYQRKSTGLQLIGRAGDHLPFNVRPYKYYDLVFPFQLNPGESATIIAVLDNKGDNLDCLPQLYEANTFFKKVEKYYLVIGVITGIMLTAFLLNIFLAISLKEKLHFIYALYILSMLLEMYIIQGIDVQYIYPNHPTLSDIFKYLSPAIGLTLMAYVMQLFLKQTRANSRFRLIVDVLKYFIILLVPAYFIIFYGFPGNRTLKGLYQQVFAISLALQLFLFFLSALEKAIQRYRPAYFYLIAIIYLWFGAIQYVINILGFNVKERIEKQPNDLQVGIVIETLIVFLGIIYRYNLFKKEKEKLAFQLQEEKIRSAREIIIAQEAEQKRFAEDLHDELGGNLAAIKMTLQSFKLPIHQVDILHNLIDNASTNARHIAHNLMPPDFENTSLQELLDKFYQRINTEGNIRFHFHCSGITANLGKQKELMIYRVVLELSNNIIKHSEATEATIQLIYSPTIIEIMAEDNGKGFKENIPAAGIGLRNIRTRLDYLGGTINIDTGIRGTTIIIQIPYTATI